MRKLLLILFLFMTVSNATIYNLKYHNITIGEIKNIETTEKKFLKIKVISSLARFMLGEDYLVYYEEGYTTGNHKNSKYKNDKHAILRVIEKAVKGTIKDETYIISKEKTIEIKFDKDFNQYNFIYIKKGKIKSEGFIKLKNNSLLSFKDTKNNVEILLVKN